MVIARRARVLAVAVVLLFAAPAPAPAAEVVPVCPDADTSFAQLGVPAGQAALRCSFLAARAQNNFKPLPESGLLTRVAQRHADDMATHGYLSHAGRDGSYPGDRARRAGYKGSLVEIIGNAPTAREAVALWMGSRKGHRGAVLSTRFDEAGLGVSTAGGEHRAVILLGQLTQAARLARDTGCNIRPYDSPVVAFCPEYLRNGIYRLRGQVGGDTHSAYFTVTVRRGRASRTVKIRIDSNGRFDVRVIGPRRPKTGGPIAFRASVVIDGAVKRYSGSL